MILTCRPSLIPIGQMESPFVSLSLDEILGGGRSKKIVYSYYPQRPACWSSRQLLSRSPRYSCKYLLVSKFANSMLVLLQVDSGDSYPQGQNSWAQVQSVYFSDHEAVAPNNPLCLAEVCWLASDEVFFFTILFAVRRRVSSRLGLGGSRRNWLWEILYVLSCYV